MRVLGIAGTAVVVGVGVVGKHETDDCLMSGGWVNDDGMTDNEEFDEFGVIDVD